MNTLKKLLRNKPLIIGVVLLAVTIFALYPVQVRTGTIVKCYYGEVIKSNVSSKLVPWWMKSNYKVGLVWATCLRHAQAEKVYQAYQDALKDKDKKRAKKALKTLSELAEKDWQPLSKSEKEKLAQNTEVSQSEAGKLAGLASEGGGASTGGGGTSSEGSSPGAGSEGGGGSQPPSKGEGEEPSSYSGSLLALIPSSLDGYEIFAENEFALTAQRLFRPLKSGDIIFIGFSVERVDDATAKRKIEEAKDSFSNGWKKLKVSDKTAYWGYNASSAALLWRSQDIMFFLELASKTNASKYQSLMVQLAEGS